jgi:tetratricopeptide (TPR) repeat protein
MAFEKAKVIKAAEKFLSQGKISAAIKEYRQIIKNDPDDLTTLNMLGDLLARAGEKQEAATCFLRIAEHYREQDFRLKAIAMYRKIEKLKPREPAIAKELAELYAAQGLIADARTQYLVVADAYSKSGESKQTLKVLHKIADLDPHNTEIRLKLADGYLKEHMPADAAKAYCEAANRLFETSQFEKSLEAYAKALELRPNDMVALKGLVSAHAALGTADEAAEILEKAVADSPDEPELVSMLAQAYIEAEDAAGAERATAQLMSHDASNHRRYLEVAGAYLKSGEQNDAARVLGFIIEPMLAGREENDLLELVNELLARDPEHVPSLRLLARIHWWQRDMEKLRATLERLAEAAEAAGLAEDERYALTQLVRLAPDEQRYVDRVKALGGSLEEAEATLLNDQGVATAPSFENVEPAGIVSTAEDQTGGGGSEFEWNSVAEVDSTHVGVSFADLNEIDEPSESEAAGTVIDPMLADPFAVPLESAEATGENGKPPSIEVMMHQELESVDFYITQGYFDIALDTLNLLERQFGPNSEIDSRRTKLQAKDQSADAGGFETISEATVITPETAGTDLSFEVGFGDIEVEPVLTEAPAAPAGAGLDSGLAEIFEEFRMEAEGESGASQEDFETHYNMATAYKEMDLLDEAIREFQVAAGLTGSADGTPRYFHCCNMLGHCFVQKGMPQAAVLWFKKGLEAPGRTAEESKALQYELGSAYEAMGDFRRAVDAFTEVYGVDVGYRDITDKLTSLQDRVGKKKKGK